MATNSNWTIVFEDKVVLKNQVMMQEYATN